MILRILFCLLVFSQNLWADSYYPKFKINGFGANQGRYSSCGAEAMVQAIENAFHQRQLPVKLSNNYMYRSYRISSQKGVAMDMTYSKSDMDILKKYGPILPDYMYPEDGEYLDEYSTGILPHLDKAALIHPKWPNSTKVHNFKSKFYTFSKPKSSGSFSNYGDLKSLKKAVKEQRPVQLTLHAEIINDYFFNKQTGMLYRKSEVKGDTPPRGYYSFDLLLKKLKEQKVTLPTHGVAVIGYDDDFYKGWGFKDNGALFIRNSWNDNNYVAICQGECSTETSKDLNKFRKKLAYLNVPGLYAIPYDLISNYHHYTPNNAKEVGVGGYTVMSLDYDKFYADYQKFKKEYKTHFIPFACSVQYKDNGNDNLFRLKRYLKTIPQMHQNKVNASVDSNAMQALEAYWNRIMNQVQLRSGSPQYRDFMVAKIPYSKSIKGGGTVLNHFIKGSMLEYYCHQKSSDSVDIDLYPNSSFWSSAETQKIMADFIIDPLSLTNWANFYDAVGNYELNQN